ncbi:MAG TPA: IscS subfamily cysteine desulfurase [Paenalcaligenes sp.]|nr:IscS subfamily cysteine desulfurase [Paenalcaligenes sp.]
MEKTQIDDVIYLDYAATCPVDERVVEQMLPWLHDCFGNPASSSHAFGWQAEEAVEAARAQVAAAIGAQPREIVWTSGATESNNLAIKGYARAQAHRGKHIITVETEHKAVLDTCAALEHEGFEVTYLPVQADGLIRLNDLEQAIRPDTLLVSVMAVNNEIGVIQPLAQIAQMCHEHGVTFHMDAVQAIGKIDIDVTSLPVDLISFSSHKVYGPKGVGALYVRRRPKMRLEPLIHGGGHERGFRSGTLPTHQIVGMGAAFELALKLQTDEVARIQRLQERLLQGLADIPGIYLNGSLTQRVPHNVNISVDYVQGEALLLALQNIAVSSGSACSSAVMEPSHVIRALGRSDQLAFSSLRLSLGRFTTEAQVDAAVTELSTQITRLRDMSPLWHDALAAQAPMARLEQSMVG